MSADLPLDKGPNRASFYQTFRFSSKRIKKPYILYGNVYSFGTEEVAVFLRKQKGRLIFYPRVENIHLFDSKIEPTYEIRCREKIKYNFLEYQRAYSV